MNNGTPKISLAQCLKTTEKVSSTSRAKRATFTKVNQKCQKEPIWRFFENLPNLALNATFWVIFKQCALAGR